MHVLWLAALRLPVYTLADSRSCYPQAKKYPKSQHLNRDVLSQTIKLLQPLKHTIKRISEGHEMTVVKTPKKDTLVLKINNLQDRSNFPLF